jgi:hypothetical protein
MVNAKDLIKEQKKKEKSKYKIFKNVYSSIETKITLASQTGYYYTWYEIPEFLLGFPLYNYRECNKYIIDKLKENNFIIEEYPGNLLLITWFPK